jgi:glycosyltransferase involved in cell wall biosynthesis
VTRLARYLLDTDVAGHLLVWELTNATPGNKHVDAQASRLLGRCRAVLSPSQTIDQNIRLNHGYKGRILRLPFWIEDCQRASSPTPCEFLADFIYLGRRDVEKGLNELIRATAIVARELPQVRVLIAGQGSEATFAALARDLGVSGNVRFQFFQTREEALSALKRCRCLVLPSYHEGYPLVLLEAARSGVPFIATAVGSVPELYGDTCAAILISPRDDHALAQAMVRTLSEAAEQYQMRRAAAQAVFRRVSSAEAIETQLSKLLLALEPTP